MRTFSETKRKVKDQGRPPDSFLNELIDWARGADDSIFAPNTVPLDVYSLVRPELGPWTSPLHRKASMCEVMRVHFGFESSWRWDCGVDTTNKTSMAHIEGQETGIGQVSWDSLRLGNGAMKPYAVAHNIETPEKFIPAMKSNHVLALDYYARLVRVNIAWAGPLIRREILPFLSRESVAEFQSLL